VGVFDALFGGGGFFGSALETFQQMLRDDELSDHRHVTTTYPRALAVFWRTNVGQHPAPKNGQKGDLIRWTTILGQRLPTIRADMVETALARKIMVRGGTVELVDLVVSQLNTTTRRAMIEAQEGARARLPL
jgi:hypothetical protein